jgi:putative phosphoesterase
VEWYVIILPVKIGILADTHDNLTAVRRAVGLFRDHGCKLIIHAGDFVAPFAARELEKVGCPVRAVFGNCDGERQGLEEVLRSFGKIREEPYLFNQAGKSFLLTHRHERLKVLLAEHPVDFLIYGHTHKTDIRQVGRTLVINPGEAGGWLSGRSTAVVLDPESREAEIISLG